MACPHRFELYYALSSASQLPNDKAQCDFGIHGCPVNAKKFG